jgi:hypothetical protein
MTFLGIRNWVFSLNSLDSSILFSSLACLIFIGLLISIFLVLQHDPLHMYAPLFSL